VLCTFIVALVSETPQQMVAGRNLILLAVPVSFASILIRPYMSLVTASLAGLIITALALHLNTVPNPVTSALLPVALLPAILAYRLEQTQADWRAANRNLALLNQASRALSSILDLDQVLATVLEEVRRLLGVVASSVWLSDPETNELVCRQATGPKSECVRGWRLAPGEGLAGWVVRTGESLIVPDIRVDERHFTGVDQATGLDTRSIITVPLRARQDTIGVLQVLDASPDRFKPTDLELLEPLAATAAIAIENARLYAEEHQRAAALARALEQQQELDRLKSEFIQNVSHELRTPLAIVRGYAELLDSGELGELQPRQREPVAVIARRVRMLSKLVDDLIAILSLETQKLRREPVDLRDLVHIMLADFQIAARLAGLSLTADIAPELPQIFGNPDLLRRMLDNLLSNAFKFTPAGGSVILRLWQEGGDVMLEIMDTGIGIPQDHLERIFERFYQVDGSMTRRYGGTGLGLALVKETVEAHGGQIIVESKVNRGSTFRIRLPGMATEIAKEQPSPL